MGAATSSSRIEQIASILAAGVTPGVKCAFGNVHELAVAALRAFYRSEIARCDTKNRRGKWLLPDFIRIRRLFGNQPVFPRSSSEEWAF